MNVVRWRRAVLVLAGAAAIAVPAERAAARNGFAQVDATGASERHGKTVKQCNDELRANAAALAKAGERPAEFFHDCWWRTTAGSPTRIRGVETGSAPAADSAQADAAAPAKTSTTRAGVAAGKTTAEAPAAPPPPAPAPAPARAGPRPQAHPPSGEAAVRRRLAAGARRPAPTRRRVTLARPPIVTPSQRRRLYATGARPAPTAQAATSPSIVMVPVQIPGLGLGRPIEWPVFPAYVPAFRAIVNHPIVPGFTRTP